MIKGITATVVFESSALNRDEKIGGNILSIKKLSKPEGVYSYLGRPAIRYSLFTSLYELFNWDEAPVKQTQSDNNSKKKTIQFDFPDANIVSYPEMDFFGYMCTKGEEGPSIIRKAPVGITKAVSLEPWMSDMAFYANHDMLRRFRETGEKAEPNPYQKEEHYSIYKVSFTMDLSRMGYQEVFFSNLPESMKNYLDSLEEIDAGEVKIGEHGKQAEHIDRWYKVKADDDRVQGYIGVENAKKHTRVLFIVDEEEEKLRLLQLLTVIKNGIMYHASTEDYGIVPLFIIMSGLRLPVPLFHSAIHLKNGNLDSGCLNQALDNEYVLQTYTGGIMSEGISLNKEKLSDKWDDFLQAVGLDKVKRW